MLGYIMLPRPPSGVFQIYFLVIFHLEFFVNKQKENVMNDIIEKVLAIRLRALESMQNCGIQAMQMQALKGRMPNWQAQQFMTNQGQELLGFGLQAPQILNGTMPQQQGNNELAQLIELAKTQDKGSSKTDKKLGYLSNDIKSLTSSVKTLVDTINPPK